MDLVETVRCRFLIIGAGVAGLRAAIETAPYGLTYLVNKGQGEPGSSAFAQGGIAVSWPEDHAGQQSHIQDTLQVGAGLCREEAVRVLVEEGAERVQELIRWGARFDRFGEKFLLAREGAHTHSRILRAGGDATGDEIVKTLQGRVEKLETVRFLHGYFTTDLWVDDGICRGAFVLEEATNRLVFIAAEWVILTSGGAGQAYLRTTNPPVATGDGVAMAHRAGALIEDIEFVQFHPTSLARPGAPSFLLSEAMRGEGAILRNRSGYAFMKDYEAAAEMASRDRVARAIWEEMSKEGGRPVYLDLTHLDRAFIRERFPSIYQTCLGYGVDITLDPVPVAPSAHYMIGGVQTDLFGRTSLPHLLAAGEVACTGVHGANRLASNSLLEGLVFGARSGRTAAVQTMEEKRSGLPGSMGAHPIPLLEREAADIRSELRKMMWAKVGLVRDDDGLSQALATLDQWLPRVKSVPPIKADLETRNLVLVARLITLSAMQRKESLGAHFRRDYPHPPHSPQHTLL